MKKKVFLISICGALIFSFAGCGLFQSDTDAGDDVVQEESVGEATDIYYDVNNLTEAQQHMFGPMGALIYCYDSDNAVSHDWKDAGWKPLSTLVNDFSTMEDAGSRAYGDADDIHLILGSFLKECASAMYADFDGELPPIPSSKDIVAWGIQYQQGDYYYFGYGDRGMDSHDFVISSWIGHPDDTCTVEVQEWTWEPESLAAIYDLELVKNEFTASQTDPYFIYSVASIEKNAEKTEAYFTEQTGSNNYYVLPESDIRYYTESELTGLTKYELRIARNEIYARHGRKFDSEDLQEYFNGQIWYDGTIEPSDFSESLLNDYEKANVSTIESLENTSSQNTTDQNTTSSAVSSRFSFADINGKTFTYASGVGSWETTLSVYSDGTFSGVYSNWSAGGADETHPRGEYEYCEFTGKFSEPRMIDDDTYSVTVDYINQTYETGTSEIKDETLYNYTDPYGISAGNEFMIYLPGTPIEDLPDYYVSWLYGTSNPPATLSSYGLCNVSEAAVFG